MDKIKKRRKIYKSKNKKKVLLSIADPWDNKVASVDLISLASCRGVPLSNLVLCHEDQRRSKDLPRSKSIPSPWYKPGGSSSSGRQNKESNKGDPDNCHSHSCRTLRTDSDETWPQENSEVPIKFERIEVNDSEKVIEKDQFYEESKIRPVENRETLVTIVQQLVRSRFSSEFGVQKRLNTLPSIHSLSSRKNQSDSQSTTAPISTNDVLLVPELGKNNVKDLLESATTADKRGRRFPNMRETGISMPSKLDDMNDLRIGRTKESPTKFTRTESDSSSVTFSNSGSTPHGSTLGSETEDEENDEEMAKVPLQAPPRRKGKNITPTVLRKLGSNPMELPGVQSPNSTITSVNSISSLIKERLQLSIPQALRNSKKRQNADYRLRGFVGMLFLLVVFLVVFAHVYYNQHVLQRAYFEKFRFNKNERVMYVYNSAGAEIIAARLGVGILSHTGVFSCLPHHQRSDSVCLEWLQQTRLYLAHTRHERTDCYHVTWQSLSPHFNPKDCFDWSLKRGHWYGAGQIQNMAYPLEQGKLDLSPFITGDIRKHPFGNVLKSYKILTADRKYENEVIRLVDTSDVMPPQSYVDLAASDLRVF